MKEMWLVLIKKQNNFYYIEFCQKDVRIDFTLKLQIDVKKLIFKWEKLGNFVVKIFLFIV